MSPLTPISLNRANKTNSGYKYDPGLAKAVGKKLLGEYYTEENLENWNNSEITLFRSVLTGTIPSMNIKRLKLHMYLTGYFIYQNVGVYFLN